MIKLIASDLDETLLQTNKHVGQYTIDKIAQAKKKGIHFVCATGRNYVHIRPTLKEVGNYNEPNTYTISLNGACVTENKNDKILFSQPLQFKDADQIYQIGLRYNVCIHVYTTEEVYAYHLNEEEKEFLNHRMEVIEINEKNLNFLQNQEIIKVLFQNLDFDYLRQIEKEIPDDLKKQFDISYSSNRYIEFNKAGINKGVGLQFLCDYLHIDLEDTMAIGDNFNDLSMLKKAGLGIGVKNINEHMKDEVKIILEHTNDEDGVGHAIEQYILKPQD